MVDFAGWSMPVQYESIVEEHIAVRTAVGMFDVSHMGRLQIAGPDAESFLDRIATRRVTGMQPGEIRYSLVCNSQGGILDDILIYRVVSDEEAARDEQAPFQLVVNASNRQTIKDHLAAQQDGAKVEVKDLTTVTAMIAVQGPAAIERCNPLVDVDLRTLGNYRGTYSEVINQACYVSRTGYTGEDGIELIVSEDYALPVWKTLADQQIVPCGLAARDTLRLEAGMPLYGHELSTEIDPLQAGLRFAVNLKDRDFIGRDALLERREDASRPVRVGLKIEGPRSARESAAILHNDASVGIVTSGAPSPTFGYPIAMGYVQREAAAPDTRLTVDIRGKTYPATVTPLPFYRRKET